MTTHKTHLAAQTPEHWTTRAKLAKRWWVSIETVKRREKSGILRAYKFGRVTRYRLSDVEQIEKDAEVRI